MFKECVCVDVFVSVRERTAQHLQRMNSCCKCNKRIFVFCSARSFLFRVFAQCVCVCALFRSCS